MNCLKGDRMDNRPVKTDPEIGEKRQKVKKLRRDAFIKIIGSAAVLAVTFGCVFGITRAPANDMYPAVHKGDLIIYYRQGKIINTDDNVIALVYRDQKPGGLALGYGLSHDRSDFTVKSISYDDTYRPDDDISRTAADYDRIFACYGNIRSGFQHVAGGNAVGTGCDDSHIRVFIFFQTLNQLFADSASLGIYYQYIHMYTSYYMYYKVSEY